MVGALRWGDGGRLDIHHGQGHAETAFIVAAVLYPERRFLCQIRGHTPSENKVSTQFQAENGSGKMRILSRATRVLLRVQKSEGMLLIAICRSYNRKSGGRAETGRCARVLA